MDSRGGTELEDEKMKGSGIVKRFMKGNSEISPPEAVEPRKRQNNY